MIRNTEYELKAGRGRREVTNSFIRYSDVQNNMSSLLGVTCSLIYQYQHIEEKTRCHILHDSSLHSHCHENPKSHRSRWLGNATECLRLDSCQPS